MIKTAIIEDNPATLGYLKALLHGSEGIEVVGGYSDGAEALKEIPRNVPDVLIADLNLPDIPGIAVIRALKERCSDMEVLVLSAHDDRGHALAAFKAGTTGYVLKGATAAEIIKAVLDVANGDAPLSPRIARYLLGEFSKRDVASDDLVLSPREKDVLREIALGYSEKKVADKLSIKQSTVHTHIVKIYQKLHVSSRTEAVLKAKSKGII